MYRGKFEAKPGAKPVREQPAAAPQEKTAQPLRQPAQPVPQQTGTRSVPRQEASRTTAQPTPKKKKPTPRHTKIFYGCYAAGILLLIVGFVIAMGALDDFLVRYEASQPDVRGQEVFEELFETPDWGEIYDLAAPEGSRYDGKEAFVTYMQNKVGTQKLSYLETSMGLSEGAKFFVRMGEENIAAYTLQNKASSKAMPDWELDTVEVFTSAEESITVHSYPGYTVTVNGLPLEDKHIVRTTQTVAEEYLPEGLHGERTVTYFLDGLIAQPKVTVQDSTGAEMTLQFDEAAKVYTHSTDANTMTDAQKTALEQAAKIYGRYMIKDVTKNTLAKHFTGDSYEAITKAELDWIQNYSKFEFTPVEITGFYAYSDTFCSARVHTNLNVTRGNGTIKQFTIDSTLFLEEKSGSWVVVQMTNANVQEGKAQVRLTYMLDGKELRSEMVDASGGVLTPPQVDAPKDKRFAGWFLQTQDENGGMVMKLVFQVNDQGQVNLPADYELEPMVLHAVFEAEDN